MFTSWKVGRVSGIDVFLHPSLLLVWLYALMSGGADAGLLFAAIFASVFLHEMGHATAARFYGIATDDITLYPIGGVARLERMPRSAGPEILIAVAGPLVNFALVAVFGAILAVGMGLTGHVPNGLIVQVLAVNLGLGLFNLLPVFPMDGGRIFRALLSHRLGRDRATVIAAGLGQALAVVGGTYGLIHGLWVQAALAAFLFMAAGVERIQVLHESARAGRGPSRANWPTPPLGFRWSQQRRGNRVAPILVRVVEPTGSRPWR